MKRGVCGAGAPARAALPIKHITQRASPGRMRTLKEQPFRVT